MDTILSLAMCKDIGIISGTSLDTMISLALPTVRVSIHYDS